MNKNKTVVLCALLSFSVIAFTACGKEEGHVSENGFAQEEVLLGDQLGDCYTKKDETLDGPALVVNGYTLDATQARNVRFISRCVLPLFPGTLKEKAKIAANTTWWSLREGILDLPGHRAARYSNCHENGRDRGRSDSPLYNCPTNIWQVGLAAAQVANYSDKQVADALKQTFGAVDSRIEDRAVMGWSASLAGFPAGEKTHRDILNSQGRVKRSWMLRNPVIGFMLVEKQEVIRECLVQRKPWCFGSRYDSARKFARNEAALKQSIADLERIFLKR